VLFKKRHLRKRRSRQSAMRPADSNYTKPAGQHAPAALPVAKVR
jgi:hypothetical protein